MPVSDSRLDVHPVTRFQQPRVAQAFSLDQSTSVDHEERLLTGVHVPVRASTGPVCEAMCAKSFRSDCRKHLGLQDATCELRRV